jgi:hypothetical protein
MFFYVKKVQYTPNYQADGGGGADNPNFIFYTPTAPLARHRLRNVLFSHTYHSLCPRTGARR